LESALQCQAESDFSVSMSAASSLCGWSERTLWRKLAGGQLQRHAGQRARAGVAWLSLLPHLPFALEAEGLDLLRKADAGCVLSQSELALHLLDLRRNSCALHWLHLAAEAGQADAMHWLGRAYLCGDGIVAIRNLGLMWLARSAAAEHVISDALLSALSHPALNKPRPLSVVPACNRI
jgi:hypothetical protein